ncbi:MAG: ABC-2 type transport system permease protein, partial [Myxococcota bacterium]
MRTLGFLLRKEFRQIFRDRAMLRMLIALPVIQLIVLANAATFEVREGRIWVVDLDQSSASRGLVQRVVASGRFVVAGHSFSMAEANEALLERQASVLLQIPQDFGRDIVRNRAAPIQVVFDAEDGAAAGVLQS